MKIYLTLVWGMTFAMYAMAGVLPVSDAVLPWIKLGWKIPELPVVEARINGVNVLAMFDTGCADIFMNQEAAEKLGIALGDKRSEGTFAGGKRTKIYQTEIKEFEVGNVKIAKASVTIAGKSASGKWRDVIFGIDFLKRQRVLMDYKKRKMHLLKEPFLSKQKNAVKLPFSFVGKSHIMIVEAEINGRPYHLHFDTGGTFSLELRDSDAKALGLKADWAVDGAAGGAGQKVTQTFFKEKVALCLGGICKKVAAASLGATESHFDEWSKKLGKRFSGTVSHNFLEGLSVEYDMENSVIWLMDNRTKL